MHATSSLKVSSAAQSVRAARSPFRWWKPWGPSDKGAQSTSGGPQASPATARGTGEPVSEEEAFLQRLRRAGL